VSIEWDEAKRVVNLDKHGLDFADAGEVLEGPCLERLDTRKDYGEDRWLVLGSLRGRVVFLVYTEREERMRIISFRKATAEERKVYEQAVANRPGPR
jgi:uncharacterized DUF497 family protein